MGQNTPNQALPYPVPNDPDDVPADMLKLAQAVEKKLVMVFSSATDRATRVGAATVGMLSWLSDVARLEVCTVAGSPGTWVEITRADRVSSLITADFNARHLFVEKTADESLPNNATPQNDNQLFLPVAANTKYTLSGLIIYNTNITADFRMVFPTIPGAVMRWEGLALGTENTTADTFGVKTFVSTLGAQATYGGSSAGLDLGVMISGRLRTGGTAGTLQLQWAQVTAHASDTFVRADSWLQLDKIG